MAGKQIKPALVRHTGPVPSEDFDVIKAAWSGPLDRDVEELIQHLDPDVELVPFGAAFEGRAYRGHDGVRQWWQEEIEPNWERFQTHADSYERVGDRLVVFGHWVARGRHSGVELNTPATWVVEVRHGKIRSWQTFTDRDEALRAATHT
jgi:ketosteroid isomerase-like protein